MDNPKSSYLNWAIFTSLAYIEDEIALKVVGVFA